MNKQKDDSMIIREIEKKDVKNLVALSIQVWLHTYANEGIRSEISNFVLDTFTQDNFESTLDSTNEKIFIAVVDEHLVGYIRINLQAQSSATTGYEIVTLYIQEHFQNKGMGKALLEFVWEVYGSNCWLTTWIHNTPAILFYEHLDFKKVGYTDFDLDGEKHRNHILAKS